MAWLDDNPPRIRQFRCPRRRPISGVIDIHTAESFPDEVGPDTGAENVARFIRDRTNYGSYHDICDSDSIIHLVRDSCESFSVGTLNLNHHGYGISAATQAHKWSQLGDEWVDATIQNMARAAARFVKRNGLHVPARWLTASQARDEIPGFIRHSVADPDRRSDPGTSFPSNTFFAYYLEEIGDVDQPTPEEEMSNTPEELKAAYVGAIIDIGNGKDRRHRAARRKLEDISRGRAIIDLITAQQPLLQAAAKSEPMSADQVQQVADACAAAIPEEFADDVASATADELHERTAPNE